ncbi:MAG: fructosamine kinase family protein [Mariprofundaceae bacterium]|nr:fructosamine kinase family protein [Mariprofundaceae bacterium]
MLFQSSPEPAWVELSRSLAEARGPGAGIINRQSIGGGSINSAFRTDTREGVSYFVKLNREALLPMFEAEAEGLQELRKANAIRVPEPVLAGAGQGYAWIVTEFITFGRGSAQSQETFGRQFAEMHRQAADRFGWHRDNTIGSTPQINQWDDHWISFYRDQRLRVQLDLAAANGFRGSLQEKGERLMVSLDRFFASYMPVPSLLHGDLWGGNQGVDDAGNPVIFDPAVYYGDREADLAMTGLFGGFSTAFYDAYNEVWPLDEGYQTRKTLYNLYHILNHANLFGGGYAMQAESMMDQLLAEC